MEKRSEAAADAAAARMSFVEATGETWQEQLARQTDERTHMHRPNSAIEQEQGKEEENERRPTALSRTTHTHTHNLHSRARLLPAPTRGGTAFRGSRVV